MSIIFRAATASRFQHDFAVRFAIVDILERLADFDEGIAVFDRRHQLAAFAPLAQLL